MKISQFKTFLLAGVLSIVLPGWVGAQNTVSSGTAGSGSGTTSGGGFSVSGTVGQAAVSTTSGAGNSVGSGFWNGVNRGPVSIAVSDAYLSLLEGLSQSVTITATDANGGTPTLSASGVPGFGAFTDNGGGNGTLALTPQLGDAGSFSVIVTATANGETARVAISVTVVNNDAPVLSAIENQNVFVNDTPSIEVTATDANGTTPTLTATGPSFVGFQNNGDGTGVLTISPEAEDVGTHPVTVSASDGVSTTDVNFDVVVTVNVAPELTAIGAQSVTEDATFNLTLSATDANGGDLTFSATAVEQMVTVAGDDVAHGGDPLAFSVSGSELAVTPSLNFNGEIAVTVTVADNRNLTDSETFVLTVTPVNDLAKGSEVTAFPTEITEDSDVVNGEWTFVDREGESVTLAFSTAPQNGTATGEGTYASGASIPISYQPNPDFFGTETFAFSVTDGGDTQTLSFEITVTPTPDPLIFPAVADQVMGEGQTLEIDMITQDADGTFAALEFRDDNPLFVQNLRQKLLRDRSYWMNRFGELYQKEYTTRSQYEASRYDYWSAISKYNEYKAEAAKAFQDYQNATHEIARNNALAQYNHYNSLAGSALEDTNTKYNIMQSKLILWNQAKSALGSAHAELRRITQEIVEIDSNPLVSLSFASFEDFGDGTGRLTLQPDLTVSGQYPNLIIKATAPDGEVVEHSFTLTINDVTLAGANVQAQPIDPATGTTPVTMSFDNVTVPGATSVTTSDQGQPLPSGFQLGDPAVYFELTTTAQFDGFIEISLDYSTMTFTMPDKHLRLLHYQNGAWEDITTSINTTNKIISGRTASLSPFAIGEASNEPPVLATNTGLSVDEDATAVLSAAHLETTDGDSGPASLVYTVLDTPLVGELQLNGTKLLINETFYQQDIDNGAVAYANLSDAVLQDGFLFEVSDGEFSAGDPSLFEITVLSVNDAPVITASDSIYVLEDDYFSVPVSFFDSDVGIGNLTVTLSVQNGTLSLTPSDIELPDDGSEPPVVVETDGVTFTQGDGDADTEMTFEGAADAVVEALGILRFTPTPDFSGEASVTITINDQGNTGTGGALSDTQTIIIPVLGINDAPTFTLGADITVDEDAGAQTVADWASEMSPGPADESDQALTFEVSVDDSSVFAALPTVDVATGALSFEALPGASGVVSATIVLKDDGGVDVPVFPVVEEIPDTISVPDELADVTGENPAKDTSTPQTFTITINAINDVPVLASIDDLVVDEGTTVDVNLSVTDDNEPAVLSVSGASFASISGTVLTLSPQAGDAGVYQVTVTATDKDDSNLTDSETFAVIVGGLVAHWLGDGDATDATGNGYDGTLQGGASFTSGIHGQAFHLNGSGNHIRVPDANGLDFGPNQDFSMALWFKAKPNQASWQGTMLSKLAPSTRALGYLLVVRGVSDVANKGKIRFSVGNGTETLMELFSNGTYDDDQWHHLAINVDRDGLATLYIDGVADNTFDISGTVGLDQSTSGELLLGKEGVLPGYPYYYNGNMDDVRLYNRILSEGEITTLSDLPNGLPVADAGDNLNLTCLANAMYVDFDGSGSSDPEGQPLTYVWSIVDDQGQLIAIAPEQQGLAKPTILLPLGTYTVTLVVNDGVQDSDPVSITVNITQDETVPVVVITEPVDGAWTNKTSVSVKGTVHEAFKLKTVTVNGKNASFVGPQPDYAFSRGAGLPEDGANTITVEVTDIAGNTANTSLVVNRDRTKPEVIITTPVAGAILSESPSTVTVEGTVSDAGSGIQTVTVNGVEATVNEATFTADVVLKGEGNKNLKARAFDVAGNRKDSEVVGVIIDSKVPMLSITSPTKHAIVPSSPVTVLGVAKDSGSGIASVTVNGEAATLDGKNYSAQIVLPDGVQTIEVIATDNAGRTTTKSVDVMVGPVGNPTVSLTLSNSVPEPIVGARVDLLEVRANGSLRSRGRQNTDVNGLVTFEVSTETNYHLRVTYNGLRWQSGVVVAGSETPVQTELSTLMLTDGSSGIANVRVDLMKVHTDGNLRGAGKWVKTDENGVAGFEILPGVEHGFKLTHAKETSVIGGVIGGDDVIVTTEASVLTLLTEAGAPIEGARVDLLREDGKGSGKWVKTDASGQASFEVLTGAIHSFRVSFNGGTYTTAQVTGDEDVTVNTGLSTLTLTSESGDAIEDARVDLMKVHTDGSLRGAGKWAKTDALGVVGFEVLPDMVHAFKVRYNGGETTTSTVTFDEDVAIQTATSTFTLTDHSGSPIEGARVDLLKGDGKGAGKWAKTDASGQSSFEIVSGYAHGFKVSLNGGVYVSGVVSDGEGVALQTQFSQLNLADANGSPVVDARIDLLTYDGKGTGKWTKTDASGLAGFETLPGCNAKFRIRYHGDDFVTELVPCGTILTLELAVSANSIVAELQDSAGQPIEGARVDLLKENGKGAGVKGDTDSSGRIEFTVVPEAKHQVRIRYNGGSYQSDVVSAGSVVGVQTAQSQMTFQQSGGAAIEGVWVNLVKPDGKGFGKRVKTDASGAASFEVLPEVEHRLKVSYRGGVFHAPALADDALSLNGGDVLNQVVSTVPTTLTLTNSGDAEIDSARVDLLKDNGKGAGAWTKTGRAGAGVASFEVLPGFAHRLKVRYNGGELIQPVMGETPDAAIEVAAGETHDTPVQTLSRVFELLDGGTPIADTWAYLVKSNDKNAGPKWKTDENGLASFDVLPEFVHKVKARVSGTWYMTEELVGEGATTLDINPVAGKLAVGGLVFGSENHPNPFNPATMIRYTIAEPANVRLVIYNMLGQQIRQLVNVQQAPGQYEVRWNSEDELGRSVSSGVYFYRLEAGAHVMLKKMLLMK